MTWLHTTTYPYNVHGICNKCPCHGSTPKNNFQADAPPPTDIEEVRWRYSSTVSFRAVSRSRTRADASEVAADPLLAAGKVLAGETIIADLEATTSLECSRIVQTDSRYHHDKYCDLHKGKLRNFTEPLDRVKIERELNGLETYSQFKQAAKFLGDSCNFDNWRNNDRPESCDYDVLQLQHRLREVQRARYSHNPEKMFHFLRTQLSRFVSGIDEETLFHPFLLGTKKLIEEYTDAICDLIDDFTSLCLSHGTCYDQLRFAELLEEIRNSYGKTAGLFSGGGTLGMRHVGTIKALFETGNLPRVISGSSAGSIVCAVLCSKTDENLQRVLENFCHGDLKVFVGDDEPLGLLYRLAYFLSNGHFFDPKNLERVMKYHLGDVTFLEAYQRTGRILNIAVSTGNPEQPRILNHVNTPHVMLWSAVVASCALPFTYKTCPIYTKDPDTGEIQPDCDRLKFTDGSVENDIPFDAIRGQFNVNHAVVAQVNPHVVMVMEDKSTAERRWKPAYAIFLDILRDRTVSLLGRSRLGSIIGQQYSGHITILPKDWLCDVRNVLRNPTPQFMEDARRKGERAVWERMSIIDNHMRVEKALEVAADTIWDAIQIDL